MKRRPEGELQGLIKLQVMPIAPVKMMRFFKQKAMLNFWRKNRATLTGYLDGLVDGAKDGKVEGLRQGRADESSYNEGYTRGYQAGLNAAKDRANNVVYPNTFRQLRDKLLSEFKNNGEPYLIHLIEILLHQLLMIKTLKVE